MMKYEIIATLGPSSNSEVIWRGMLASGVTAFRLNTSHLSLEQLLIELEKIDRFFGTLERSPALVLDLQGSKWRLGQFPSFELVAGASVNLVYKVAADQPGVLPVPHLDFFRAAALSNGEIVLNDARVRLVLEKSAQDVLRARVVQGGPISSNKGITFASSAYRKEALNEKDQVILKQTRDIASIRYAISYVKDAAEMSRYRAYCGPSVYLAAKLERKHALDEALQMAGTADELWLCRGDLGAELGVAAMAKAVYRFSARVKEFSIPVHLAGQVLEHMVEHPTPTRSEICYLYEALQKGFNGLVLSDETAIGHYPVESCRAAAQFMERT